MSMLGLQVDPRINTVLGSSIGSLPIKAKRCIFLFMWGGPSQLDTFDMKPDAPAEIRGEFKPIQTAVPGDANLRAFYEAIEVDGSNNDPANFNA